MSPWCTYIVKFEKNWRRQREDILQFNSQGAPSSTLCKENFIYNRRHVLYLIAIFSRYKKKETASILLQWKSCLSFVCFWASFSHLHLAETFHRKLMCPQHYFHWRTAGMGPHTPGHTCDSEWPGRVHALEENSKSLFSGDEKIQPFYVKNQIAWREWRNKSQSRKKYCKTHLIKDL